MKRIFFNRKTILRAIHAAAVALYLAMAATAHAQTATGDGNGNITVSGTGSTSFSFGTASTPPLSPGGTLTISPGTSDVINSNSGGGIYVIQVTSAANVTSSGTLIGSNVNVAGGRALGLDINPASGSANLNNLGGVTAASANSSASAIYIYTPQGTGTVTNEGALSATGKTDGFGIFAQSNFGDSDSYDITNSSTILVTSTASSGYLNAVGIFVVGGYTLQITNSGAITTEGTGSNTYSIGISVDGGTVSVSNLATIHATSSGGGSYGIDAIGSSLTVTNSQAITSVSASGYGYGIIATGVNGAAVTNSGSVSVSAGKASNGIFVNAPGSNLSLTNSGLISATSSANTASGLYAKASAGNITLTNSGQVAATSQSGAYTASGINATAAGTGNVGITNSGNLSASGYNAFGISGKVSGSGILNISNTGGISIASSGAGSTVTSSAIYGSSNTGDLTISNSGALTVNALGYGTGISGLIVSNPATISINNQGTISVTTNSNYTQGRGIYSDSLQNSIIVNSGAITVTDDAPNFSTADGIYGFGQNGSVSITNSASVTATSSNQSACRAIGGSGAVVNINNTGALTATGSATYGTTGISATATVGAAVVSNGAQINTGGTANSTAITVTGITSASVSNNSALTVSSSAHAGTGIIASSTNGPTTVSNTGNLMVGGLTGASGIGVTTAGGTASLSNSGNVVLSSSGGVSGLATSTGNNNSTITNSGNLQLTGGAGTGAAIVATNIGTSTATITNTGNLSVTTQSAVYGIQGVYTVQGANYSVINSGAINLVTNNSMSGTINAYGILAYAGGNQSVDNRGAITISGTSLNVAADGIFCSGATSPVTNSGALNIMGTRGATGIYSDGAGATVTNSAVIRATSASGYVAGIFDAFGLGVGSVTNSGSIVASGATDAVGISAFGFVGGTVTNSADVSVAASAPTSTISGLYYLAPAGNINVNNSGHVTATSQSGTYSVSGIYTKANSGASTITNSGYAGGFNTAGGGGYGINVDPNGPIIVNNTGTAIGTTTGIYLHNAGTVNNYGLASGGTYSIQVPTGSTVNLDGASPVLGLLKGGANDTSTSQLNFNLAISGNHLTADKAALNAAIAQYDAAYTTANGNGANVDSEVVTINGIAYQWEDFLGIADNLIQGRLYGATPGYQGIGRAVDNFDTASARGTAILAALDNLPDSAVAGALAQLSPQSLQVLRNIAFDGASFTAANVNNHLANLRDGLTGFDTSGFTVNTPGVDPTLTQMRSRLLAFNPAPFDHGLLSDSSSSLFGGMDMKDMRTLVNTQPFDRWSAFISGSVVLANLDNTTSNIGDSDYTTGSVLAGVDYRFDDHFTVGALFNYAHTSVNLDGNGSKATVDSYSPGIYASYVDKKGWYGNAMLMYGFNNNTDDRQITIPGISGDNHGASEGGQVTSNFTGGYEFKRGNFKFGPVATLQYVHLSVGSFQEQGPTSLSIDQQEADSLRTQLGFQVRYSANVPTCYGPLALTPHFQASWQHEYMDNSDGISSQFNDGAGGGSFVVQGQQPERDSAFLDLGVDAQVAKNVTLFIDYQAQAGQNDFFAQSAQGGVRIGF